MPCTIDPEYIISDYAEEAARLTRLLCAAMTAVDNRTPIPIETLNWWEDHKQRDEKRKRLEEKIQSEEVVAKETYELLKKGFEK